MSSEKQTSRVLTAVVGQDAESVADHGGARHLAEGADMRQAGGAVARLEQHLAVESRPLRARDQLARLLERPRLGDARGFDQFGREFAHDILIGTTTPKSPMAGGP